MTTSAQTLNEILAAVSQTKPDTQRFTAVVAQILGLSGDDREAEVVKILSTLVRRIQADVEQSPLDDASKKHVLNYVAPF
ncbi:MAG: hypothetical protein P8X51_17565, partial [Maritimibacter sp.]